MSSAFKTELLAINKLRAKYPNEKQRTLASRIKKSGFGNTEDNGMAASVGSRPLASIYNAIRRYDKKPVLAN